MINEKRESGVTIYTDFYGTPVGRIDSGEPGVVVQQRLAPPLGAMIAVTSVFVVVLLLPLVFATGLPFVLTASLAVLAGSIGANRYAHWYANEQMLDIFATHEHILRSERQRERGGLSEIELERLKLLTITRDAGLPWADYDSGELWRPGDARVTAKIAELEAKRDSATYTGTTPRDPRVRYQMLSSEPTVINLPAGTDWEEIRSGESDEPIKRVPRHAPGHPIVRTPPVHGVTGKPVEISPERLEQSAKFMAVGEGLLDAQWLAFGATLADRQIPREWLSKHLDHLQAAHLAGRVSPAVYTALHADLMVEMHWAVDREIDAMRNGKAEQ